MSSGVDRFLNPQQQVTQWPSSQADQGMVLDYLAGKITPDQNYAESQMNEFLKAWHTFGDWSMLRRALVDSGRLHRTPDGGKYWRPQPHVEAYLVGGIILLRRHILAVRAQGSQMFIAPGGAVLAGEAPAGALKRILASDLGITIAEADELNYGQFEENSPTQKNETDHWQAFMVRQWQGEMHHAGHLEELRWLTSELPADLQIDPVLRNEILPLLRERNLID